MKALARHLDSRLHQELKSICSRDRCTALGACSRRWRACCRGSMLEPLYAQGLQFLQLLGCRVRADGNVYAQNVVRVRPLKRADVGNEFGELLEVNRLS